MKCEAIDETMKTAIHKIIQNLYKLTLGVAAAPIQAQTDTKRMRKKGN